MDQLLGSDRDSEPFLVRVRDLLQSEWGLALPDLDLDYELDPEIRDAINRSINSGTKTYRYVLPTQIFSKLANSELDCRAIQASADLPGSFDARTVCHRVIVPFDRDNSGVLGASAEPYVNKPLRIPAILPSAKSAQRDKSGFDDLLLVLNHAQDHPASLPFLAKFMMACIKERLTRVSIPYPVPLRISLEQCRQLLQTFLHDRTGGLRKQVVATALFELIGELFNLFASVRGGNINASDASTGNVADLECLNRDEEVVLGVEVKDRQLELRQVQDKVPGIRQKGISEFIFLVQGGIIEAESGEIEEMIERQFHSGQNIYVIDWHPFLSSCLILFGQDGRRQLLIKVGNVLDRQNIDIQHRQRWSDLLSEI